MLAQIRSMINYEVLCAAEVISYDLPIATSADDSGSIVLRGTAAAGNEGHWLLFKNYIWLIEQATIADGTTELTLRPPVNAFSRSIALPNNSFTTAENFISSCINKEFKNNSDDYFKMPYLELNVSTGTPYTVPTLDNNLMFNLADYIRLRDAVFFDESGDVEKFGAACIFIPSGDTLTVGIQPISSEQHTAFFDNNRFWLEEQAHDYDRVSKVTVLGKDSSQDFYLLKDGTIVTLSTAVNRTLGKWVYVAAEDDATAGDTARRVFANNSASHRIEFYSTEEFDVHDTVRMHLRGYEEYDSYEITCVRISSADSRYHYTCGTLPLTLTEKVGKISSSGSQSSANSGNVDTSKIMQLLGEKLSRDDVDSELSGTSTNPVQNKVIKAALGKKLDKSAVDSKLDGASTNPVQNKTLTVQLQSKLDKAGGEITGDIALLNVGKLTSKPGKIAVFTGDSNIIYYRTFNELLSDLGVADKLDKSAVDSKLDGASTNPVQNKAVKTELDKKADKTALDNKFDKAGGTLTGNLTGQYLTGTWLQTTEAIDLNSKPGKIAVLDGSGWVYYRTPAELASDIGVVAPADYIVEKGTSSGWQYRKWNSGVAECWRDLSVSGKACSTAVGSWFRTAPLSVGAYPFTFTAAPNLQMQFETFAGTGGLVWSTGTAGSTPTTRPANIYIIRMSSATSITGTVHYYAIGKWK